MKKIKVLPYSLTCPKCHITNGHYAGCDYIWEQMREQERQNQLDRIEKKLDKLLKRND